MMIAYYLCWISFAILFYCYIGYGFLISVINGVTSLMRTKRKKLPYLAPVTMIVAAYNEEPVLKQKIANTLDIDYPPDLLKIIFVTDGSTDNSVNLLQKESRVQLLHQEKRAGKYAAIKRAMKITTTPFVIFSDANSLLNRDCINRIMMHYNDPKIGGVAGEKKIFSAPGISAVGEAEGLYWQYESYLKQQDAEFNTVTGAAGELYSIRTQLFREMNDNIILDDFIISMQVCLEGYRIAYEPGAYASELPSLTIKEEEKRKIRISAGAYQSIRLIPQCLNIFRHPLLSFQYISRRFLRWVCCPLMLVIFFASNLFIVAGEGFNSFYRFSLIAQLLFYALALIGWIALRSGKKIGWLSIPFYFVFMNYCLFRGWLRYISGTQPVLWERVLRQGEQ